MPNGSAAAPPAPPGIVDRAVADADLRLERRVAAEQQRVVQRDAVVEHAGAHLDDRRLVERVRHADARLEHVLVRLGEPARRALEERQHRRIVVDREVAGRRREAVARQDDAVVARPADDLAVRRIDHRLVAPCCRTPDRTSRCCSSASTTAARARSGRRLRSSGCAVGLHESWTKKSVASARHLVSARWPISA